MDSKTIEAMRAVMGMIEGTVDRAESQGRRYTGVLDGDCSVDTFRTAAEGFRALVGKAADERAVSERSERDALKQGGAAKLMWDLHYALDNVTREAEKDGKTFISFHATDDYAYRVYTVNARATVLAIEALLDAAPAEPAPATEPTLEECVAAINRKPDGVAGITGWKIQVSAKGLETRIKLSPKEVKAMGKTLIAREKAAEAKGGA